MCPLKMETIVFYEIERQTYHLLYLQNLTDLNIIPNVFLCLTFWGQPSLSSVEVVFVETTKFT